MTLTITKRLLRQLGVALVGLLMIAVILWVVVPLFRSWFGQPTLEQGPLMSSPFDQLGYIPALYQKDLWVTDDFEALSKSEVILTQTYDPLPLAKRIKLETFPINLQNSFEFAQQFGFTNAGGMRPINDLLVYYENGNQMTINTDEQTVQYAKALTVADFADNLGQTPNESDALIWSELLFNKLVGSNLISASAKSTSILGIDSEGFYYSDEPAKAVATMVTFAPAVSGTRVVGEAPYATATYGPGESLYNFTLDYTSYGLADEKYAMIGPHEVFKRITEGWGYFSTSCIALSSATEIIPREYEVVYFYNPNQPTLQPVYEIATSVVSPESTCELKMYVPAFKDVEKTPAVLPSYGEAATS